MCALAAAPDAACVFTAAKSLHRSQRDAPPQRQPLACTGATPSKRLLCTQQTLERRMSTGSPPVHRDAMTARAPPARLPTWVAAAFLCGFGVTAALAAVASKEGGQAYPYKVVASTLASETFKICASAAFLTRELLALPSSTDRARALARRARADPGVARSSRGRRQQASIDGNGARLAERRKRHERRKPRSFRQTRSRDARARVDA